MRNVRLLTGCVCLALAWNQGRPADAQTTSEQPTVLPAAHTAQAGPQAPGAATTPQAPVRPAVPPVAAPPVAPVFAEAAPAGTEAGGGAFNPQMIGDSLGIGTGSSLPGTLLVPSSFQNQFGRGPAVTFVTVTGAVNVPVAFGASGYKIADNEGVRAADRVFLNFDYFTHVFHNVTQATVAVATPGLPGVPVGFPDLRIAREILGVEKTFLGGDASIGLRLPFLQYHNQDGTQFSDIGDVSAILKFCLVNEPDRVFSTGIVVTLPTAPTFVSGSLISLNPANLGGATQVAFERNVNPTILQPFVGCLWRSDRVYVHGFSSLAIPTDQNVSTTWFNDIGVGWYAYRGNGSISAVVPTAELHLETPFGHQGSQGFPVSQIDTLVATLGCHFVCRSNAILTLAYEFPLSGPQPFSSELVAQLNYHY
jgi:hypothetical protein